MPSEYCRFQRQLLPADHSCFPVFLIPPLPGIGFAQPPAFHGLDPPWGCRVAGSRDNTLKHWLSSL